MDRTAVRQPRHAAFGAASPAAPEVARVFNRQHGCRFCARLDAPASASGAVEQTGLLESDEFVAWPSLGALVEGWVLAVTKTHRLSVRELDGQSGRRFLAFIERVARLVEASYGPVAVVEHGPVECGSAAGCSIDHAHAHVIPWSRPLRSRITELCPAIEWHEAPDPAQFAELTDPAGPYLFLSTPGDGTLVGVAPVLPSQLVRRAIAAELGDPERFDWKSHPRLDVVRATVHTLSPSPPV
jgi:ATP adenylyltransferase